MTRRLAAALLTLLAAAVSVVAQQPEERTPILDTSSFWRCFFVVKMPAFRKGDAVVPLPEAFPKEWEFMQGPRDAKWLTFDSPAPPEGWTAPAFDDHGWCRMPGVSAAKIWSTGGKFIFTSSCYMSRICRRGRFEVVDPKRAGELMLILEYSGGAAVYLNGAEIGRGHIAKDAKDAKVFGDTFADDYREGEPHTRTLSLRLPADLLRKGTNVLGVEIIRAPYREGDVRFARDWTRSFSLLPGSCALESVRLDASKGAAVVPNVARPKGLQVWNSDVLSPDFDLDYAERGEPLRPVTIVGARNGSFSGKVVVGSDEPIKGLKATVGDLVQSGGKGKIAASAVRVRYARPGVTSSVEQSIDIVHWYGGTEAGANGRYLASADRFDALEESAPAEVPVWKKGPDRDNLKPPGITPIFGAVVPVWVTVDVPADAPAGDYEGTLTIACVAQTAGVAQAPSPVQGGGGPQPRAAGPQTASVVVPVKLRVCDWRLPAPRDFRTFVELLQSPESVALWYEVPPWSDAHFKLLDRSLKLTGLAGAKTCYVPLICDTNMGNAGTLVRWVRKGDGTYTYDFTIMDRYLDLVEKHLGRPAVVCIYVWDNFLPSTGREGWGTPDAKGYKGGPEVELLDRGTGKVERLMLPLYGDGKSRDVWKPLLEEIRARMKKRGLEDVMMLGVASDRMPDATTAAFFKELLPGVPWVSCSHNFEHNLHGVPFGYQANAYDTSNVLDPTVARQYGWKRPNLVEGAHFPRLTQDIFPLTAFRFMGEMNIARNYRGFARLGADFWPVLKDKRGRRVGSIAARFAKSSWWNLNLITSLLAPGPEGAIATARYEMLREGVQECEARIAIERALTDKDLRRKLGDDLARRAQDVLDERTRAMLRGVFSLIQGSRFASNRPNDWWQVPGVIGSQWFLCSDWQGRTEKLFTTAGEVARALEGK